jgi:hypothetical protein
MQVSDVSENTLVEANLIGELLAKLFGDCRDGSQQRVACICSVSQIQRA